MAQPEIRVQGLAEVIRKMRELQPELLDVLKDVNVEVAEVAAGYLRRVAPQKSGALVRSIRTGRTLRSAVVKLGNARQVPYVGPINYGWRAHNIEPNPFIERGKDFALPRVIDLAEERLQELVDRLGG